MLVYGDADETIETRPAFARLAAEARGVAGVPAGLERHAALTTLFIEATTLVQGVIEAEFGALGYDDETRSRRAVMRMTAVLAQALVSSQRRRSYAAEPIADALSRVAALALHDRAVCRRAEGYAFYALYPEGYIEAAQALEGHPTTVIGIRSIGLGLAALVAATNRSPPPVTVRPVGPPFSRRLALSPALRNRLVAQPADELFAIVDEGPGLSGSSFGAVIDSLAAIGVEEPRIRIFPGHAGSPGSAASPTARARWQRLGRHVVDFDTLYLNPARPQLRLETWFADLVGPPVAPLRDLSGGAWRDLLPQTAAEWPPANVQQERRKFLLTTDEGRFLLKFVGLGRWGELAFRRARRLSSAGFVPEAMAFRHGFMLQRWQAARPADFAGDRRRAHLDRLAAYLAFRTRAFPAPDAPGADLQQLAAMARQNGREALGGAAAAALDRLAEPPDGVHFRRVATDNRLHAWEWLETADGRLLKADAVEHCAAHDLVGHQDIAWDVAGAGVELDLSPEEQERLARDVAAESGIALDPRLIGFLLPCYLAFQLGAYSMAADALAGAPEEQARLSGRVGFYRGRLAALLGRS